MNRPPRLKNILRSNGKWGTLYGDSIGLGSGLTLVRIYYNVHSNKWNILWIVLKKAS